MNTKAIDFINQYISDNKMRQNELCSILGVKKSAISRILNKKRDLTLCQCRKFCEYYNVDPKNLI